MDVQNYIMDLLPTRDLSVLMRTCRYFLDTCLLPLCARSNALPFDFRLTLVPSFRRFLRVNAGPSSRAHLVTELCISMGRCRDDKYACEARFTAIREEWSAAFLDILRHCRNLRRISIHRWFLQDISFPLLVKTIGSSLHHLEDLAMPMPFDTDSTVLRRLSRLPLRSLSFLKFPASEELRDTNISLDVLPRSLTELDLHRCPRTDASFMMVHRLGIRDTMSKAFVANVTAAFPNVSFLVLRHDKDLPYHVSHVRLLDKARARNKAQWQSQCGEAWPSVSAVWAEDPSFLYALGFSRRVSSISIPTVGGRRDDYIAPVLADASPRFLELRIQMDNFRYASRDWEVLCCPSTLRLTVLLYTYAVHDEFRFSYILVSTFAHIVPVRRPEG